MDEKDFVTHESLKDLERKLIDTYAITMDTCAKVESMATKRSDFDKVYSGGVYFKIAQALSHIVGVLESFFDPSTVPDDIIKIKEEIRDIERSY